MEKRKGEKGQCVKLHEIIIMIPLSAFIPGKTSFLFHLSLSFLSPFFENKHERLPGNHLDNYFLRLEFYFFKVFRRRCGPAGDLILAHRFATLEFSNSRDRTWSLLCKKNLSKDLADKKNLIKY